MSNYDVFKNMSVEELAEYIYSHDDELNDKVCKSMHDECPFGDDVEISNCKDCIKQWLLKEVNV